MLSPPPLQLKPNCDGAIFHGLNCAGLGVVIRNTEDLVIAALSERVPLPPSVDDLEAMAWRRSVTFAIEIGLQDVIFEGDSKVVYKHLSATSSSMASFGHITDETRVLASNMLFASFSHVKRSSNAVYIAALIAAYIDLKAIDLMRPTTLISK